jgi:hypothetical protein
MGVMAMIFRQNLTEPCLPKKAYLRVCPFGRFPQQVSIKTFTVYNLHNITFAIF